MATHRKLSEETLVLAVTGTDQELTEQVSGSLREISRSKVQVLREDSEVPYVEDRLLREGDFASWVVILLTRSAYDESNSTPAVDGWQTERELIRIAHQVNKADPPVLYDESLSPPPVLSNKVLIAVGPSNLWVAHLKDELRRIGVPLADGLQV